MVEKFGFNIAKRFALTMRKTFVYLNVKGPHVILGRWGWNGKDCLTL